MNKPTSYEILITKKVAQLPIPDMSDSIWASIEMELDAGSLPDGENKQPTHNPTKGLAGKAVIISSVTLVILASILIFKSKTNQPKKNIDIPAIKIERISPVIDSNKQIIKPIEKNINPKESTAVINNITPQNILQKQSIPVDTILKQTIPDIKIDSLKNTKSTFIIPTIDSSTNVKPIIKKPKGVKGITDDDYRIKSERKDK